VERRSGQGALRLPPAGRAHRHRESGRDEWRFPIGTKFWEKVRWKGKRVETRYLAKRAPEDWRHATFLWNVDQSDAREAREGQTISLPGGHSAYDIPGPLGGAPSDGGCTMKRTARRLAGTLAVLLTLAGSAGAASLPGERELWQRIFAPCCYRETLDMHASPTADELKFEIHGRLERGETPDAITAELVRRFGDRILTRPPPMGTALALFAGAGLAVATLVAVALRRTGRRAPPPEPARPRLADSPGERQRLEDRLADEIEAFD
jgi:cytochrome c-type biogenesis protein CcmH